MFVLIDNKPTNNKPQLKDLPPTRESEDDEPKLLLEVLNIKIIQPLK